MTDLSMAGSGRLSAAEGDGRRSAAARIAAGTILNAVIWLIGSAAGVSFSVTLAVGNIVHRVSLIEVVLATALSLAAGYGAARLLARRSARAAQILVLAAALFGAGSAAAAPTFANDTATGLLLAVMHLVATAAFVAASTRVAAWSGWRAP